MTTILLSLLIINLHQTQSISTFWSCSDFSVVLKWTNAFYKWKWLSFRKEHAICQKTILLEQTGTQTRRGSVRLQSCHNCQLYHITSPAIADPLSAKSWLFLVHSFWLPMLSSQRMWKHGIVSFVLAIQYCIFFWNYLNTHSCGGCTSGPQEPDVSTCPWPPSRSLLSSYI